MNKKPIYLMGDTHGLGPIFKIVDNYGFQDCNIIHVGDLGLGFQEITRDVKNLQILDEMCIANSIMFYSVRGNHDNPIFWDRSKGLNLPRLHNVELVEDYSVLTLNRKNILCVGGAISIDRQLRKNDRIPTWWEDEVFKYEEEKLEKLRGRYETIDAIVTHSAPDFAYPQDDNVSIVNDWHNIEKEHGNDLKLELRIERLNHTSLYHKLVDDLEFSPKYWFYGHFHSSKITDYRGTKFKLLNINEIYEYTE